MITISSQPGPASPGSNRKPPYWRHHLTLAIAHLGVSALAAVEFSLLAAVYSDFGMLADLEFGLLGAAPNLIISGVYAHLALGEPPTP